MAAQAQKPRRRIVPQLITSPSSQDRDEDALLAAAQPEAAVPPAIDQREQSEWARENLGPDRKVFLDLSALSNTEIDWKQVRAHCKRAGRGGGSAAERQPRGWPGCCATPLAHGHACRYARSVAWRRRPKRLQRWRRMGRQMTLFCCGCERLTARPLQRSCVSHLQPSAGPTALVADCFLLCNHHEQAFTPCALRCCCCRR